MKYCIIVRVAVLPAKLPKVLGIRSADQKNLSKTEEAAKHFQPNKLIKNQYIHLFSCDVLCKGGFSRN